MGTWQNETMTVGVEEIREASWRRRVFELGLEDFSRCAECP